MLDFERVFQQEVLKICQSEALIVTSNIVTRPFNCKI